MSWPTNNDTFWTSFGQGNNGEESSHYDSTWRQENAPVNPGNSSYSEIYWTDEPHRENYVPAGIASNTSSWSGAACPGPSSSVYGSVWPSNQRFDEARLGSWFGASGGDTDGLGMSLPMGMEVAAPVMEQAFPAAPNVLPTNQFWPRPSLDWTQLPGPPSQPSSWKHPVHTARQHSSHSISIGPGGMRPGIPSSQLAAPPVITGDRQHRVVPTGPLPSAATPNSVQPWTHHGPVPVSSSPPRPRGQRWRPSNASTFRCMWRSRETQCTALIVGDRKCVSSHLRDEHVFTCDGQRIVCEWGDCMEGMQRRNVPRHILARHFEVKVECPKCGLTLSRADASKKHQQVCTGPTRQR